MANAAAHTTLGGFEKESQYARLTYDFAEDGGATGTISLATVGSKLLVTKAIVHVETACTSGGSATVAIGASTADDDGFMNTTSGAVANLIDDFTVEETTANGLVVGAAETIDLVIATAALTAGKINVELFYVLVD